MSNNRKMGFIPFVFFALGVILLVISGSIFLTLNFNSYNEMTELAFNIIAWFLLFLAIIPFGISFKMFNK